MKTAIFLLLMLEGARRHKMKIKFSGAGITDGRGKLGGNVASRNKGGAFLRNKVTPLNPQSTAQTLQRSNLVNNSQAWRGLTQSQRDGWNSAAPNFPRTDQFGDTNILSGFQLFCSLNGTLKAGGSATIDDAPTPQTVVGPATLTLTAAKGTPAVSLAFTVSPIPADTRWLVFATPGVSPGVNSVKNQYRLITTLAAAATSPANLLTAYTAVFGVVPDAGQKVFVRVVPYSSISGQQGTGLETSAVVAA